MRTIEEYIELANLAVAGITFPKEPKGLYEPIIYGMSQGGKRLRPAILLAACDAGACRLGAMMGDASDKVADALYEFAVNLGIAFQLQDDWLDVYGDPKVFGKAIGGDIMNNKKTYLLITALNCAKEGDREELDRWLNDKAPFAGEKIAEVTAVYNRLGVGESCRREIERYSNCAIEALRGAGLPADAEQLFEDFIRMLMGREK